jgi:hypothetical protein
MTETKSKSTKPEKGSYVEKALAEQPGMQSVKVDKVKEGDLMAFTYYGKIAHKDTEWNNIPVVQVKGVAGSPDSFQVRGKELIESALSADQFSAEEKVSKTKAAEILSTAYNRPFTVCFDKQDGEERVLRGRLVEPEPLLGRSHVEDLDITEGHRLRLVDHRTIRWIIVNCVKYTVGK